MIDIYGASDDLIEIEGDVREEFPFPISGDDVALIGTSNGALVKITYANSGVWRITPVAGLHLIKIEQAPEDDDDNYSDHAVIDGDVLWVLCGAEYATRSGS